MSPDRPAAKTYLRPMRGWWRRNPFFLRYMLREASALFLTGYALTLLFGLWRLSQGTAAFEAWRTALATPLAIGLHGLALVFMLYHSWTWFQVMPKTLPPLPLPAAFVTAAGVASALLLSWLVWAGLR
jgi:fumarate reductase subunit C